MPGLFVAIALFATLAFMGTHAKVVGQKVTLTPGRRWLVTVSFMAAPDQARFTEVLKGLLPGAENVFWTSPTSATIKVSPIAPITLDVGTPGPGGLFMVSSVAEAPPNVDVPRSPPILRTLPTPSAPTHRLWTASLETAQSILDKPTFEKHLVSFESDGAKVVSSRWIDSRHLDIVIRTLATADPAKATGSTHKVHNVPTTILSVKPLSQAG